MNIKLSPQQGADVFISWSGERSKAVALALRDWLPKVLQAVRPWMSDIDIDKGAKWDSSISHQLAIANCGIICLTSENRESPAIHFESGALSKSVDQSRLWTYLHGISYSDIRWPLSEFQHTAAKKNDTRRLLQSLNAFLVGGRLSDADLSEVFEMWWPKLDEGLQRVPENAELARRSTDEMIEEILELSRSAAQGISRIQPYEGPSGPQIVQLATALSRLVNKSEGMNTLDSMKGPLRALQASIQHICNRIYLPEAEARIVFRILNKTLLSLHPKIRNMRG